MRDWHTGTLGKWTSMGVLSNGEYGIEKNLIYSYPVTVENKKYSIVKNVPISEE
jgi:malate dehydrogenase